mmetsp:Transcript_132745/g.383781  ORF Transcript_132745/g.383781 Transcript_132745/m.383781 type:complete len:278 (+) Transcript_132745:3-836(+)
MSDMNDFASAVIVPIESATTGGAQCLPLTEGIHSYAPGSSTATVSPTALSSPATRRSATVFAGTCSLPFGAGPAIGMPPTYTARAPEILRSWSSGCLQHGAVCELGGVAGPSSRPQQRTVWPQPQHRSMARSASATGIAKAPAPFQAPVHLGGSVMHGSLQQRGIPQHLQQAHEPQQRQRPAALFAQAPPPSACMGASEPRFGADVATTPPYPTSLEMRQRHLSGPGPLWITGDCARLAQPGGGHCRGPSPRGSRQVAFNVSFGGARGSDGDGTVRL